MTTTQPTALISNPQDMYPNMEYMRWDIINDLIKKNNYKTYLEIGVYNRALNFNQIKAERKICVDPDINANADFIITSDTFFNFLLEKPHGKLFINGNAPPCPLKFDIIFIDGLHTGEQVYKDILNALACLNEGGTIVCHDMNPTSELMAQPERRTRLWCGDCWRAWVLLRQKRTDITMRVIDSDFGVGIIQSGKQRKCLLKPAPNNWKALQTFKKEWLNLISVDEFKKLYL